MTLRACVVVGLSVLVAVTALAGSPGEDYVMENEPSGERYDWEKTKTPEQPWLLPYDQTLVTKIFLGVGIGGHHTHFLSRRWGECCSSSGRCAL
jgi:hypothetical protein